MGVIETAAAVASGATTALAIAQETLARVADYAAVQPAAWITRRPADEIIAEAAAIDARVRAGHILPLAGVPFAIKDNIDLAGVPTTAACPAYSYTPAASAAVVERLVEAGAIPIGKTNLDQFATGLNGTRSPYGAPACVFNRDFISGGSSSGSAVTVSAGLVAFALGTDTAGSGRIPAAFNGLVGFKPTKGRWSTRGLVAACRSLDCISVFTQSVADARLIDDIVAGFDPTDAYSRPRADRQGVVRRVGVLRSDQIDGLTDPGSVRRYRQALAALGRTGAELVEVDMSPLHEAASLLYDGPWIAERAAVLSSILQSEPDALDPAVRMIAERGLLVSGVDVFRGQHRLAMLRRLAERLWAQVDMLALPTAPTIYTIAQMRADPIELNSNLGVYTNFVNLLDMSALALPAGFRRDGPGFGITLIGPSWTDLALLDAGQGYLGAACLPSPPPLDRRKP